MLVWMIVARLSGPNLQYKLWISQFLLVWLLCLKVQGNYHKTDFQAYWLKSTVWFRAFITVQLLDGPCRVSFNRLYQFIASKDASFSKVFGIYTLKYSSDLDAVFGEDWIHKEVSWSFHLFQICFRCIHLTGRVTYTPCHVESCRVMPSARLPGSWSQTAAFFRMKSWSLGLGDILVTKLSSIVKHGIYARSTRHD